MRQEERRKMERKRKEVGDEGQYEMDGEKEKGKEKISEREDKEGKEVRRK